MPKILIVDEDNNEIGSADMEYAHQNGIAHRIVRVFLFNSNGQLLLQKRSKEMSFPGLWDQSVGGHVDEGETNLLAAKREAAEEIGIYDLELKVLGTYYSETDVSSSGVNLRRFNILYAATADSPIKSDPYEVEEVKWVFINELKAQMLISPHDFTKGLCEALEQYEKFLVDMDNKKT